MPPRQAAARWGGDGRCSEAGPCGLGCAPRDAPSGPRGGAGARTRLSAARGAVGSHPAPSEESLGPEVLPAAFGGSPRWEPPGAASCVDFSPASGRPGVLRDRRPRRPAVQPPSGRVRGARPVRRPLRTRGLCAASSGTDQAVCAGRPHRAAGGSAGPAGSAKAAGCPPGKRGGRGRAQSVSTRGSGPGGPAAGKPRFLVAQGRGSAPARAGGSRLPLESPGELRGRRRLFPPLVTPSGGQGGPWPRSRRSAAAGVRQGLCPRTQPDAGRSHARSPRCPGHAPTHGRCEPPARALGRLLK